MEAVKKDRVKITKWVAFVYVGGGQICAQHFTTTYLDRNSEGGSRITQVFTPEQQIEAFERQDNVCLNLRDQKTGELRLIKNKVLVFPDGESVKGNPKAADVVIQWAISQGLEPIRTVAEKSKHLPEQEQRVAALEGRVLGLEKRAESMDGKIDKILDAVTVKK